MKSNGKIAVVTGASSGIGRAVSIELGKKGYEVYACGRGLPSLKSLTEEYAELSIYPYEIDISEPKQIIEFGKFLNDHLPTNEEGSPKLDVLYNNAGQSCTFPALDVSPAVLEQCFQVNVFGHINMCHELAKFVINAKGTILFTGSLAGIVSFPFGSVYSASKAAIHSYARGLHLELKPFGVRVINVITGGVDTAIADTRPLPEDSFFNFKEGQEAFAGRQLMAKKNKPMSPEEYAKQVVADILSNNDPVDVYRGSMAKFMHWVALFVPFFILEFAFIKKFKLGKVFSVIEKKQAKKD